MANPDQPWLDHVATSFEARGLRGHVALLVAASVGVYLGVLDNGFVYDDRPLIVDNPWLRDTSHLTAIFSSDIWGFSEKESNYYRPLMHVFNLVVYKAGGLSPILFHVFGLVLHALTTVCVFVLARQLVGERRVSAAPPGHLPALLAGLVFATHPIHVEAVAWACGQTDLQMALAYLGALVLLESSGTSRRPHVLHALAAASYLVAALSKEPGLTLPAIVAALDVARRRSGHTWRYWLTRYGFLLAAGCLYWFLRVHALGGAAPHASGNPGWWDAASLAGTALWRYLAMLVYPHPLNAFHTLEASPIPFGWVLLVVVFVVLAVAIARRNVEGTAALALFLVPLAPALAAPALLPGLDNPWAERYLYLPSAGATLGLAMALAAAQQPPIARRLALGATAIVIAVFAGMTVVRVPVWHDDLTLWSDTVAKSPSAGQARGALGYALFARGDVDRAIEQYRTAISLSPDHADPYLNLGVALALQGRHDEAIGHYAHAVRLQPRNALAHSDLALSLSATGRHRDAIAAAAQGVRLAPRLAVSMHALGVALGNAGQIPQAADAFRKALELDPTDEQSRVNLARAEAAMRTR